MKKTNRLLSILLALAVVFTMALPTFAEETTGSITVANPVAGQTYTAYKIFDVTYDTEKTTYAYSIAKGYEWLSTVEAYAAVETNGLTLSESADGTGYIVTINEETFSAAKFADALKAAVDGKTGKALTVAEGSTTPTVTGLELGYYFVTSTNGALCNLTTTNPAATINDKNDFTFDKTDDDESVEVGQVVHYVVEGKVPATTGFTTYKYEFTDKMSEGLTFNKDVKVFVGGNELAAEHYTLSYDNVNYDFVLSIDVMELQDKVAQKIEVKYSATVNSSAVTKVEKNHVELTYSNNPSNPESTETVTDEETVYTAKIVVDKYAAGSEDTKLAGAQFVLINNGTTDGDGDGKADNADVGKFYKVDEDGNVSWVETQAEATVVETDENGAAEFPGLEDGNYLLRETAAPAGYNMLTEDVEVEVKATTKEEGGKTVVVEASLTVTEGVENQTGIVLPETGGIGTTIFYVLGGALTAVAAVLLITRKRMSTEE